MKSHMNMENSEDVLIERAHRSPMGKVARMKADRRGNSTSHTREVSEIWRQGCSPSISPKMP